MLMPLIRKKEEEIGKEPMHAQVIVKAAADDLDHRRDQESGT